MIIKRKFAFSHLKKRHITLTMRAFAFLCFTTTFGLAPNTVKVTENSNTIIQQSITGTVTDINGQPLPGATVVEKGTRNGAQTDFDGKFSLNLSSTNATLVVSYIGFKTNETPVNNQTTLNITLEEDVSTLDEVVVVGYGVQKKVNLTSAVSVIGSEAFENRPTANAIQSLQGTVPGLVISNSSSGGEPGAAPNINIRGYLQGNGGGLQDGGPLVLVDGLQMDLNNINPEDIESVSVLKDAAAAAIYGSRASAGAILVTTKSGKNSKGATKVTYSNNFSYSFATRWPENVSAIDFAYTVNDARINNNQTPYHDDTDLANILANMANPGSAPSISSNTAGTDWSYQSVGIDATGATDWNDILFRDFAERRKHDLSIAGGDQKLNYYFSAGAYDEDGLLAVTDETFQRYNLDAKISAKANDWLTIELNTKYRKSFTDFPLETTGGTTALAKSRVLDLLSKIKPTLPQFDPIYGEELLRHSYYPFWESQRIKTNNTQLVLAPRLIIEPVKNLKIDAQFNFRRDDNLQEEIILSSQDIRPAGLTDRFTQEQTSYSPTFIKNEYFSPNIVATFDQSYGGHNFNVLAGYQSEENNFHSINANAPFLATDNFISISTSLDQENQTVGDALTHWANQSIFSRFRYNFKEKYLFEFTYRSDYSSRFEPGLRQIDLPSVSAGWNVAKENFWPFDDISTFKLRASYGQLGNQSSVGSLYGYISSIDVSPLTTFLFDGTQELRAVTPGLTTENLTWETQKTTDIGFDLNAFNNKLGISFSWYRADTDDVIAPAFDLPAQLGTAAPLTNVGITRVQGWDFEINWRQQLSDNFSYNVRAVLGDYKRTVVEWPNETNFIGNNGTNFYSGRDLGEIWGYTWDGWFQTDDEAANHPIDQSGVTGWAYGAGDTIYKDLNEDGEINQGSGELGDNGDFSVIGNSTPRYQYGINLGFNYKNLDFNAFIQGVGKRDVLLSNHQRFRGPAQGPFHINVWEEHLDYFRPEDTTSPLGPNTDAYFPAPYTANPGRNNKNYARAVDRYIQNGAYARLKSLQIGYTIPKKVVDKFKINNFRIFLTGENLFTVDSMLFFDPEIVTANQFGSAQSYPLSRIISTGINVSF